MGRVHDDAMANTYTNLHYHVVFSTKHRAPFLTDERTQVHEYLGGCIRTLGGTALEIGGISDHVHALLRLKPTHCVADVLREIKKASSIWLRESIASFQWQDGYSAFTVSSSQIDRVCRYIQDQEQHHRKTTFADELRTMLKVNGIAFDERFLL